MYPRRRNKENDIIVGGLILDDGKLCYELQKIWELIFI